jgi:anti-sigma factor RsiW
MARRSPDEWVLCPPGELERLAERLRRRRRRRVFLRTATAVAVVAAGGGLSAWLSLGPAREPSYGGITCTRVQALAGAYARGELSATVREQVRQHLAQCPRCAARFQALGRAT